MLYWSALILILANLAPLYGVLALDWSITLIMLLYWCESVIIAFFTILKIVKAKDSPKKIHPNPNVQSWSIETGSKLGICGFFTLHFGLFMLGHLIFIGVIFLFNDPVFWSNITATWNSFLWSFFALFVGHAFSYVLNYLGNKEYAHAKVDFLLWGAYQRVILMHLVIMGCGFLSFVIFTRTPLAYMAFAVLLKMAIDLRAHFKSHRAIAE